MHPATVGKRKRYGVLGYLPEERSKEADLWGLNAKTSPLLLLPPEIRNKIYRILLARRRIHVLHNPKTGTFHCITLKSTANPWMWKERHLLSRGLTLLGSVCRQLYHETDLIPYSECAWSWQTPGLMERYVLSERRLPVLQRRAVREVAVRGGAGFGSFGRRLRGFFGGLEVLWFWDGAGWECEVVERERVVEGEGKPN